jgi:stress response protein YsnF
MNSAQLDKDGNNSISANKPNDNNSVNSNHFSYDEEIVKKIPLIGEKFTVTKKTEETQLDLVKKWITSTKKIEIPIKYEEIYINGKEFDSYDEGEIKEIFSKIKDKISDVFLHDKHKNKDDEKDIPLHSGEIEVTHHKNDSSSESQNNRNEKLLSLSIDKNNSNSLKEENLIPIWGEEVTIDKKIIKLLEIFIKKYETNEKQKIDVNITTERLTIKYPDKHKEEII